MGGAPANFAYHAQQLGATGTIISAVGKDPLGNEILSIVEGLKIQSHIARLDAPHRNGKRNLKRQRDSQL